MRAPRSLVGALFAIAAALSPSARAQVTIGVTQQLGFNEPESWAMKYFSSITQMTGMGPPEEIRAGRVVVGLEGGNVPYVAPRQQVVGFGGTKAEALNQLPAYGRLRLDVGLPEDFTLTLGYVPPVRLSGMRPNLFAASLGRPLVYGGPFTLGLRAFGQVGNVNGAITCSVAEADAGSDPARNPLGCLSASSDTLFIRSAGAQLAAGYRIEALHGLEPHAAISTSYVWDDFAVDARYGGVIDHTKYSTSGFTVTGEAGLNLPLTKRVGVGVEALYTPLFINRPGQALNRNESMLGFRGVLTVRAF